MFFGFFFKLYNTRVIIQMPFGGKGLCKHTYFRTAYVECPKPDQHWLVQMGPGLHDLLCSMKN